MDLSQAQSILNEGIGQAQTLMKDPSKITGLLGQVTQKLKEMPALSQMVTDIPVLVSMLKGYVTREYTQVSPKVVAVIIGAFLYIVRKEDLVPDNIPIVGMADDVAVVGLAVKMCQPEIEAYKAWKKA